jgi:hypothetical protein
MPALVCRWPNGDLSMVVAQNKAEATIRLDEFGNPDHAEIFQVKGFLIYLRLNDLGRLEVSEFGEEADEQIMRRSYPLLWKTLISDELAQLKENSPKYRHLVRKAVEGERTRMGQQKKRLPKARTEAGKRLQEQHDFPAAKADRLVEQYGQKLLEDQDEDDAVH